MHNLTNLIQYNFSVKLAPFRKLQKLQFDFSFSFFLPHNNNSFTS